MSCAWAWDWSINLPRSSYEDDSDWGISNTPNTNSTTGIVSPASPDTPGETHVCQMTFFNQRVTTPIFPGGPHVDGWFQTRVRFPSTLGATDIIWTLDDGVAAQIEVRSDSVANDNPVPLRLVVGGTIVGTTTTLVGDAAAHVIAVGFNLATNTAELWVDGTEEVAAGVGGATTGQITRAKLYPADNVATYGLLCFFDNIADDGSNPNYWGSTLNVNSVTDGDASFSIFGGAGTKLAAVDDRSLTTGVQTTTDGDDLGSGYQNVADLLATWAPTNIIHVAAVHVATADTLNNHTLTLNDDVGLVGTQAEVVSATAQIVALHAPLASGALAWTTTKLDALTANYNVAS